MMQTPHPMLAQAFALSRAGRNPEAILLINQLAAQNEPGALATLAEMKWRGGMVAQDVVGARDLYRRASAAGHLGAAISYTNLLASGVAGDRDWIAAIARLKNEAKIERWRAAISALIGQMRLTAEGDPQAIPERQALSNSPEAYLIPRLFTAAECDFLLATANPLFTPSVVNDASGRQVRDPIRTSDGATIHWLVEDPAVHALNRRLAAASDTAFEQGEALQVLRYRPGQEYKPHLDFVRSSENQRRLTALVYLNEDYRGGETCFLKTGMKVKGRKGDCLIFRSATPDRQPDPMSEHAGLPVTAGVKYLASRWIRETRWIP